MIRAQRLHFRTFTACLLSLGSLSQICTAESLDGAGDVSYFGPNGSVGAKSASTQTIGARATVTPSATLFGGFELAHSSAVYLLVRGNSLGALGVTPGFMDAPRVRIFNSQNEDIAHDLNGRAGFNGCTASNSTSAPVFSYYQSLGIPASERDACATASLSPGAYTFSVTPSIPGVTTSTTSSSPSSGEVLFEVKLGPAPFVENNQSKTERLLGGTWSFSYIIGTPPAFMNAYAFSSVQASTARAGDFVAFGRDEFNEAVVGGYDSSLGMWVVYDSSIILDRFFTYTFSDLNHISGCYYQIVPPGTLNLSRCYAVNGSRSPAKVARGISDQMIQDRDEIAAASVHFSNPVEKSPEVEVLTSLQRARAAAASLR